MLRIDRLLNELNQQLNQLVVPYLAALNQGRDIKWQRSEWSLSEFIRSSEQKGTEKGRGAISLQIPVMLLPIKQYNLDFSRCEHVIFTDE